MTSADPRDRMAIRQIRLRECSGCLAAGRPLRRRTGFTRAPVDMIEIFKAAIQRGASDIHIKSGDFIRARVSGELAPLTQQRCWLLCHASLRHWFARHC